VKPTGNMLLWFYGGTQVPTRSQHKPWLVFCNHRGWIVHKQSIFLPGSPLEAIPAAFHFVEGWICPDAFS
jgi:hypothetical protein